MVLEDEITEVGSSRRPHISLEPTRSYHSLKAGCLGTQQYYGGCPELKQGLGSLLLPPLSLLCQLWWDRHLVSEPPSLSFCSWSVSPLPWAGLASKGHGNSKVVVCDGGTFWARRVMSSEREKSTCRQVSSL